MTSPITITRCQPFFGAEIGGVDLRKPLTPDVAEAIRAALWQHQVIILRDQDISHGQHLDFARIFSKKESDYFTPLPLQRHPIPDYPEIHRFVADGKTKAAADMWHSDECFKVFPSTVSVLRSRVVPSLGGDTVFASGIAAYARLPDEMKARIRTLQAWNGPEYFYARHKVPMDPKLLESYIAEFPSVAQPVVRIHPESGRPALFVNPSYTGEIVGMDKAEGAALLAALCDHLTRPDFQMRVRWTANAVVVWDNRAVLHYAVADYDEPREMERVLVSGHESAFGYDDCPEGLVDRASA